MEQFIFSIETQFCLGTSLNNASDHSNGPTDYRTNIGVGANFI